MSLIDSFDIFPVLRTKRIVVGQDKITIQSFLSTKDNNDSSSWIGSSRFKQYIKIFFLLVPESQKNSALRMMNPETRFSSQSDLTALKNSYEMAEISLSEILQQDYVGSVSDIDSFNGTMVNNLYFEVDIDALPKATMAHFIFGFVHLDMQALASEYQVPDGLLGLGGNATFDALFEVKSGRLRVPKTVDILYSLDGTPYFGPAHYHSPSKPGPKVGGIEYVGWMAGYADHPDSMGPPLNSKKVSYIKVSAPGHIDDEGFASGFNGSMPYEFSTLDATSESTGGDLAKQVRKLQVTDNSILSFSDNIDKARNAKKRACLYYSQLNKSNILISAVTHFIRVETANETTNDGLTIPIRSAESHHGVGFSLEYGNLLSLNSPLGWLFEYHLSADKPNASLIEEFVDRTKHLRFKVSRVRMTNSPTSANAAGVPEYEIHETEREPTCLIDTADNILGSTPRVLLKKETKYAYMQELNLRQDPSEIGKKFYRSFLLKDFDLYNNVNFGNYKYVLDMDIIDGIKKTIKERFTAFKTARIGLTEYARYANIPSKYTTTQERSFILSVKEQSLGQHDDNSEDGIARRSESVESKEELVSVGSFDPMKNEYTSKFRQSTERNMETKINSIIDTFVSCYEIIFKGSGDLETLKENLRNLIHPSSVLPGGIERFTDMCNRLESAVNQIAVDGQIDVSDEIVKSMTGDAEADINTASILRSLSPNLTPGIISLSAQIPEVVTALTGAEILYEPPIKTQPQPPPISMAATAATAVGTIATALVTAQQNQQSYYGDLNRTPAIATSIHTCFPSTIVPAVSIAPAFYFTVTANQAVRFPAVSLNPGITATNRYNSLSAQLMSTLHDQSDTKGSLTPKTSVFKPDSLTGKQSLEKQLGATISYSLPKSNQRLKKAQQRKESNTPTKLRSPEKLSLELEKVLCEAALKEPERKEFIKSITSEYKSNVLTIDLLGSIHDDMQKISNDLNTLTNISKGSRDWKSIANTGKDQVSKSVKAADKAKGLFEENKLEPLEIQPGKKSGVPIKQAPVAGTIALIQYVPKVAGNNLGVLVNNVFLTS